MNTSGTGTASHDIATDDLEPLMDLPPDVLVMVLQRVPQQQRLSSCALVARAWQAAAGAATPSVHVRTLSSQDSLERTQAYLARHGQHITSLVLHKRWHRTMDATLERPLPCPQLRCLKLIGFTRVRLAAPEGAQPGILQVCAQLTRLGLSPCPVPQFTAALTSRLTGLQHLALSGNGTLPDSLSAALAHMQPRHLTLCGFTPSDASLQPLSRLTSLRQLGLQLSRPPHDDAQWTPDSLFACLGQLPHLTALELPHVLAGTPISASTTPGLTQLTGLQHLDLRWCTGLQPAVLAGMQQIRHLNLGYAYLDNEADVSALLAWLAHAQHLTHLDLQRSLRVAAASAAAYSALTASSALEHLDLSFCHLPPGIWAHMFPEGRRLSQLHALKFSRLLHTGLMGASDVTSLLQQHLVQCCPELRLLDADLRAGAPCALTALQQLQQLTELRITGVTDETVHHLAQLTGLGSLRIRHSSSIDAAACAPLTTLTKLQLFAFHKVRPPVPVQEIRLYNKAPEGEDPDVWSQLAQHCQQLANP